MCSRLRSGSASIPSKPSNPEADDPTRSAIVSSSISVAGAAKLRSTAMGVPDRLPGV